MNRNRLLKHSHMTPLLSGCALLLSPGCTPYRDATVPNRVMRWTEPATKSHYLLYVPSKYRHSAEWSLVVLCHGTWPWDTPHRQIRGWAKLAEDKGFLVAAPQLSGTSAATKPPVRKQIARQSEDERRILGTVRHICGAYNISEDRIFLTGWSAGSYAALYTGLRNPQIFRALALQQGNFESGYLAEVAGRIDPHQPGKSPDHEAR